MVKYQIVRYNVNIKLEKERGVMALIKCPECGKEISDAAKSCPNCGHPVKIGNGNKKSIITILSILVVVVAIIGIILCVINVQSPEKKR